MEPTIRDATPADLPAIDAILDHYILNTTCTYQTTPDSPAQRSAWLADRGPRFPVIVAEQDNTILGWGALSMFRPREGYRFTVENSVYVRPDRHRQGIGASLLRHLIQRGTDLGHHSIIAVIDAEQSRSIALHAKLGFTRVAELHEVGFKFGRWLDTVYMQLLLNPLSEAASEPAIIPPPSS